MDFLTLDYHAARLIDRLFNDSSHPDYLSMEPLQRVDYLADVINGYVLEANIFDREEFTYVKGSIQTFTFHLLLGEQGQIH